MKNIKLLVHSAEQSCLEVLGLEGDAVKVRELFCMHILSLFIFFLYFFSSFSSSPEAFQLINLCTCVGATVTRSVMSITHVTQHPESSLTLENTTAHPSPRPVWHPLSGMSSKS